MNEEEIKIKEFDKEQLELLLNDLQDIDKFTGFKDGAFKYELGKYQANLLVNCIKNNQERINKAIEIIEKCRIKPTSFFAGLADSLLMPKEETDKILEILKGE